MSEPWKRLQTGTVAIFDLEYTSWAGARERNWSGPGEYREIVEIGAVALHAAEGFREIANFSALVKPARNPQLSDYFKDLTGITQEAVDSEGLSYTDARAAFLSFARPALDAGDERVWSYGEDGAILLENDALFGVGPALPARHFLDIRRALGEAARIDFRKVDSGQLLEAAGLASKTQGHRALNDARSIAALIRHLLASGR